MNNQARKMFRWSYAHNVALCKVVVGVKPTSSNDWEIIAARLSEEMLKEDEKAITKRGAREHLDMLIKKHKKGERLSRKKYA